MDLSTLKQEPTNNAMDQMMNPTQNKTAKTPWLAAVLLAMATASGCGSPLMYHVKNYHRPFAAFAESNKTYFHSSQTGRIIPKEPCATYCEPPCYGYEPTSWTHWPSECPSNCPVQGEEVLAGQADAYYGSGYEGEVISRGEVMAEPTYPEPILESYPTQLPESSPPPATKLVPKMPVDAESAVPSPSDAAHKRPSIRFEDRPAAPPTVALQLPKTTELTDFDEAFTTVSDYPLKVESTVESAVESVVAKKVIPKQPVAKFRPVQGDSARQPAIKRLEQLRQKQVSRRKSYAAEPRATASHRLEQIRSQSLIFDDAEVQPEIVKLSPLAVAPSKQSVATRKVVVQKTAQVRPPMKIVAAPSVAPPVQANANRVAKRRTLSIKKIEPKAILPATSKTKLATSAPTKVAPKPKASDAGKQPMPAKTAAHKPTMSPTKQSEVLRLLADDNSSVRGPARELIKLPTRESSLKMRTTRSKPRVAAMKVSDRARNALRFAERQPGKDARPERITTAVEGSDMIRFR